MNPQLKKLLNYLSEILDEQRQMQVEERLGLITGIETWLDPFPMFVEADFERMPDGRILAVSRFVELHPLKDKPLPYPPGKKTNVRAHYVYTGR